MDNNELMASDPVNAPNEAADAMPDPLDGIPAEMPKEVRRVFQQSLSVMGMTGSRESAIDKKLTGQHIDKMLDNERLGMELQAKDIKGNRYFLLVIVAILAALAIIVLIVLRDQPEMISKIMIPVITAIGGAAGGYGFGKSKRTGG